MKIFNENINNDNIYLINTSINKSSNLLKLKIFDNYIYTLVYKYYVLKIDEVESFNRKNGVYFYFIKNNEDKCITLIIEFNNYNKFDNIVPIFIVYNFNIEFIDKK